MWNDLFGGLSGRGWNGPASDNRLEAVLPDAFEREIDHRSDVEGEELRGQKPADDRDAERLAQFGAGSEPKRDRQGTHDRRHRGHHDRAETQQTGLLDRPFRGLPPVALRLDGEIDHHDGILLDDADQHDDTDDGNDAQIHLEEHEGEQRADAGGREPRENRDWVDEAFVENAEHDVDHDDGRENEPALAAQGLL